MSLPLEVIDRLFDRLFAINGELRLEAESISFAGMDDDRFEALYSATINVLIAKVFGQRNMSRADVDLAVNNILTFA